MNLSQPPVSLTQHVASLEAGEHVIAAAWLGSTPALATHALATPELAIPALALSGGAVMLGGASAAQVRTEVHGDAGLLVATVANGQLFTGGGDGRVCSVAADGRVTELARDAKGGWIDAVAASGNGAIAFSVGKRVTARDDKGKFRCCKCMCCKCRC